MDGETNNQGDKMDTMILTHKFTDAGLGQAPFKFIGIQENAIKHANGHSQAGGCCDFCSTGIRWEHIILSADGKRSVVGSDCIRKVGDAKLMKASDIAKKAALREKKEQARRDKWEAIQNEQRDRNGGLTDWEVENKRRQEIAEAEAAANREKAAKFAGIADRLRDWKGGFRDSVALGLDEGRLPMGRGMDLMLEILAKQAGRKGSAKFEAELEKLEKFFDGE
jgi:hypothetical protein